MGENPLVIGTDCGLGGRVHRQIAWAKLRALRDGEQEVVELNSKVPVPDERSQLRAPSYLLGQLAWSAHHRFCAARHRPRKMPSPNRQRSTSSPLSPERFTEWRLSLDCRKCQTF
ncbi:MAG: hypothetical protein GEU77_02530 [Deltaproteobacteria bacterium]|nr:hypothetical protein [Deltaproteobacteria bacterium]